MNRDEKLIVALDVPAFDEAKKLVGILSPTVKVFKVGKELFTAAGPEVVRMIHSKGGKVFLDLKFHDIPNTVGAACEAATRLGVFMMNVHAVGGKNMMIQAVQSVHKTAEELKIQPPILIGVTVLTSMKEPDLKEVGIRNPLIQQVETLAVLAKTCGLDGVVASGHELELIKMAAGKDFLVVTPGVRPVWAGHGDQKRVMTPKEAIEKGADFIVVGRPITQDKNPMEAAQKILSEMG